MHYGQVQIKNNFVCKKYMKMIKYERAQRLFPVVVGQPARSPHLFTLEDD